MSRVQKLIDSVFAAIPTTASSNTMDRNPIDKSLEGLLKNPQYGKVGTFEYIKFGQNDDIDTILEILKDKSATHSGILNRKAKMVSGDRLIAEGLTGGSDKAWNAFEKAAGGKVGSSLEVQWKRMGNLYETQGAVGVLVRKSGKEIISVQAVSPRQMRIGKLNSKNEIDHFILRPTFVRGSGKLFDKTERKVPVFELDKNQKESLLYIKNPATENDFYGTPNYIGAYNFIEADYKFGVTIHNAAENGFQPKVMATFVGRNMSDEQKETHADAFKDNFSGSDRELAIVNYVRREEEMPKIDKLQIENLDKTISTMADLNDAKILTAHSVTNPALFGVMVSGKLGNSGTELESAYNVFRATEMIPDRNLLLDGLTLAFSGSKYDDIEFIVEDLNITPQENRGGDVTEDEAIEDKPKDDDKESDTKESKDTKDETKKDK